VSADASILPVYSPFDVNTAQLPGARRSARIEMTLAVVFHTLCVLWIWRSWGAGLRGGWLLWIDLPVSLLYLSVPGSWLLAASLVLGGLQWAGIGWLLWRLVGALTRPEA
jgi:hypothetical protein